MTGPCRRRRFRAECGRTRHRRPTPRPRLRTWATCMGYTHPSGHAMQCLTTTCRVFAVTRASDAALNEDNQRQAGEAIAGAASNRQYQQQVNALRAHHLPSPPTSSCAETRCLYSQTAQLGGQIAQSSSNPYVASVASNAQVQQGARTDQAGHQPYSRTSTDRLTCTGRSVAVSMACAQALVACFLVWPRIEPCSSGPAAMLRRRPRASMCSTTSPRALPRPIPTAVHSAHDTQPHTPHC